MPDTPEKSWPTLLIPLASAPDEEDTALLAQAAADAGALGSAIEPAGLRIYLPADATPELEAAVLAAVEAESHNLDFALETVETERTTLRPGTGVSLNALHESIPDAPWSTAWKVNFRPLPIGDRLLIRPDWEQNTPILPEHAGRLPIYLRPGQGFGTGNHETTRLALEMLERHLSEFTAPGLAPRVLDFGAGSAVLAIAAVALGAPQAVAIEADPEAIPNASENIELNGFSQQIDLILADSIPAANLPPASFDLIVCNVIPPQAMPHLCSLAAQMNGPDSRLIYSGFLADELEGIESFFVGAGLVRGPVRRLGEWGGLIASLKKAGH